MHNNIYYGIFYVFSTVWINSIYAIKTNNLQTDRWFLYHSPLLYFHGLISAVLVKLQLCSFSSSSLCLLHVLLISFYLPCFLLTFMADCPRVVLVDKWANNCELCSKNSELLFCSHGWFMWQICVLKNNSRHAKQTKKFWFFLLLVPLLGTTCG
jgi:hypothetical protein